MTAKLAPLGYYKWHWQRFRANRRVQKMDYVARGLYRELLDEQWSDGSIPNDIEDLADICGCPLEVMQDKWPQIRKCFETHRDGQLFNQMLENQRTEMDRTRIAQSMGGKKKVSQIENNCTQNENQFYANKIVEEMVQNLTTNAGKIISDSENVPSEETNQVQNTMPLDSQIEQQCWDIIGHAEEKKLYNKDLKAAVRRYGHDDVLAAWELWVGSQSNFTGKRPISTFIRNIGTLLTAGIVKTQVSSPALDEVEKQIAVLTDSQVFFHTQQKPLLASLVKTYSKEEVLQVFNDFWNMIDEASIPWAAKNFIEQCGVRVEAMRLKKEKQNSKEKLVGASLAAARQAVEAEIEEEVEDEL